MQVSQTRRLAVAMMTEAQAIASKLGITFRHTIEQRVEGAEKVGEHEDLDAAGHRDWQASRT